MKYIYLIVFLVSCKSTYNITKVAQDTIYSVVSVEGVFLEKNNDSFNIKEQDKTIKSKEIGSGFVIKRIDYKDYNELFVVTNYHVITENLDDLKVTFFKHGDFKASYIGSNEDMDITVLKVKAPKGLDIKALKLGSSEKLKIAQYVYAIGNPYGYSFTITSGIISYLNREGGPKGHLSSYIQTDIAINEGNSGGPLFNNRGEVIGINNWIRSTNERGSIGLSFSIPIDNLKKAIDDIIEYGQVKYKWLGLSVFPYEINPGLLYYQDIRKDLKIEKKGIFVSNVYLNSPAYRAGIKPGYVISKVNNKNIISNKKFMIEINGILNSRYDYNFEMIYNNKIENKEILLEDRTEEHTKLIEYLYPGINVYPLNNRLKKYLYKEDINGIIVISTYKGTSGGNSDLKAEDIIIAIDDKKINGLNTFYKALNPNKNQKITYLRDKQKNITFFNRVHFKNAIQAI